MQQLPLEYKFLYRGRQMYMDELNSIASNVGNLIVITTFWAVTPSSERSHCAATSPMRGRSATATSGLLYIYIQ